MAPEAKFHVDELASFPEQVTGCVDSPCFLVNEDLLIRNAKTLEGVRIRTGAKVLLALKAFSMHSAFPALRQYLDGVCASGPMEARLGKEEFGKEVHTFAPAYSDKDMEEVLKYSDTVIFNSVGQLRKFRDAVRSCGRRVDIGLRVNPGYSEVKTDLYNPVISGSRLGAQPEDIDEADLQGIDGLHFHALCEQNADSLVRVLASFEQRYGKYMKGLKWVNFGGGHHITRKNYDVDLLVKTINDFKERYGVEVHIEPGEAVALNAGVLVATVLDIVHNGIDIAILDTSAEAHMPDVLAAPYRPEIIGAGKPGELGRTYRLGGLTCLAGDVIGDYSFDRELRPGDRIVFLDMAHYTMVKTTMFNGVRHPSMAIYRPSSGKVDVVRTFGYDDYRNRLS